MSMMKAVVIHRYGDPDELTLSDVPRPHITDDTVLVKVHAAGMNPVDWKTRKGLGMAKRYGDAFPLIIGWDISGVVEGVGAQVSDFKAGDEVYGMVGFPDVGAAYAEYVLAKPAHLAHKPANISHVEASVVPLVALTSWQALFDVAGLEAGQTVLIHAAAGGVGHIATQLARWKGADVIGTASARNADFLRSIGVTQHIDYTQVNFEEVLHDIDVVYETRGYDYPVRSAKVLKDGGCLVSIERTGTHLERDMPPRIRWQWMLVETNQAQLQRITELVEAGHIKPIVSNIFSLDELPDAHRQSESGRTRGKIAIQIMP